MEDVKEVLVGGEKKLPNRPRPDIWQNDVRLRFPDAKFEVKDGRCVCLDCHKAPKYKYKASFIEHLKTAHEKLPAEQSDVCRMLNVNPVQLLLAFHPLALMFNYLLMTNKIKPESLRFQFYSFDILKSMGRHITHQQELPSAVRVYAYFVSYWRQGNICFLKRW